MFRKVLCVYLMLLALAGPGLCYCSILQLTHQKATSFSHECVSNHKAKHRHQCGCKHPHKKHSTPVQPCSSNSTCPSCPCNHHEQIPVVLPDVDSILNTCLDSSKELNYFETIHALLEEATLFSANAPSLTCLSGWHQSQFSALGILRAPFVLLC